MLYQIKILAKEEPVSGGEKQRLAIARAFFKKSSYFILDEAISTFDKKSENAVQKSIDELQKGRTSIADAHRLKTMDNSYIILNIILVIYLIILQLFKKVSF